MPTWEVRQGHVLDVLRAMPAESVHCVVTSPPYYGLRDYGLPPQVWGGDRTCQHRWTDSAHRFRTTDEPYTENSGVTGEGHEHAPFGSITCGTCGTCGAWRGSLGLEPTPELFVQHLVEVFAEVHRVLRDDGTLWLNLGDSYSSGGRETRAPDAKNAARAMEVRPAGLGSKNLLGIPWRVALALQAAQWTLRMDVIWSKPNAMPESVRDRPTRAHEYLFLFSKGERYFYDAEAIREPRTSDEAARGFRGGAYVGGATDDNGQPPGSAGGQAQPALGLDDRHRALPRGSLRHVPARPGEAMHPRWHVGARVLRGLRRSGGADSGADADRGRPARFAAGCEDHRQGQPEPGTGRGPRPHRHADEDRWLAARLRLRCRAETV